ncbi:MAG: phospho-N-acetylmuramoyl-pentapeptide-transferase, partial [Deltaproteobacteria bacterium]|nr:phospho-N-acetylmuramoyl-pentapeptide-transferase [Deltaproteobacteria bacterium]
MLYHIFYGLSDQYSWLNVFRYQTFRAMMAFLFAFAFVLFLQPVFIRHLQLLGIKGQPIRDDGPKRHESKRGTPTMGGLLIVSAVFLATVLFANLTNKMVWISLAVMLGFAVLGFIDDWRKVTRQNSKGLSERAKLIWQVVIATGGVVALIASGFSTELTFPFFKNLNLD